MSPSMSRAVLVTGATGFVGSALVPELARAGYRVHALARAGSERSGLEGCGVEWHAGDVEDAGSLARAFAGVARESGGAAPWLVHNAACISYRTRDRDVQWRVNVEGTRRVLAAARRAGVERAVHVSSVVAVGFARAGETLDEDAPLRGAGLRLDYVETKRAAEELALEHAAELDLRVVNPAAVFGPSSRPSNSERFLRAVRRRALGPLAAPGGMDIVGLADVAAGIRLALERGRAGRRYILSESHRSALALARSAARLFGVRGPRAAFPRWAWSLLVAGARAADRVRPLELMTPQALCMLGLTFRFDSTRARTELGWSPAPFDGVLAATVAALSAAERP